MTAQQEEAKEKAALSRKLAPVSRVNSSEEGMMLDKLQEEHSRLEKAETLKRISLRLHGVSKSKNALIKAVSEKSTQLVEQLIQLEIAKASVKLSIANRGAWNAPAAQSDVTWNRLNELEAQVIIAKEHLDALKVQTNIISIITNFQTNFKLSNPKDKEVLSAISFNVAIDLYLELIKNQGKKEGYLSSIESELIEKLFIDAFGLLAEAQVAANVTEGHLLKLYEESHSLHNFNKLIDNTLLELATLKNNQISYGDLTPSKFDKVMADFLIEFDDFDFLNNMPKSKLTECKSKIEDLYKAFALKSDAIQNTGEKIDSAHLDSIYSRAKSFSAKVDELLLQPLKNDEVKKPKNVWLVLKDLFISLTSLIRKNGPPAPVRPVTTFRDNMDVVRVNYNEPAPVVGRA